MERPNPAKRPEILISPEVQRVHAMQAADRINSRIVLGHTIEFRSAFVKMNFPVMGAFVEDGSLYIDTGPCGEILVAPEHYHFFSGIDLSRSGAV